VVPSIFSDGCVLQTNAEYGARSYVFGYASSGDAVRVVLRASGAGGATMQNLTTFAGGGGAFSVTLDPLSVSAPPFDIVVSDETTGERHVAAGCVVGDVYVCSGQSNQCFSAEASFPDDRADAPPPWNASYANVRLFAVQMAGAAAPLRDFLPVTASSQCSWNHDKAPNQTDFPCQRWLPSTPHTNGLFSAVCLLTALEISRRHTGPRPLGLVYSAFGGTSISLWAPPEDYKGCPGAPAPVATIDSPKGHPTTAAPDPGSLYNAMIAPMARFSLRSFLFFQGENDVSNEAATPGWYACRHERLIAAWRRQWGMGDVAFCFVQLGPVVSAGPPYGLVRAAQALARKGEVLAALEAWASLERPGATVAPPCS
jgi:sialate O-acetylesterase